MGKFEKEIRAYALKNAIEFGKAEPEKILPKLFQHGLEKKEIKDVIPEIKKVVKEVNKLKKIEREKEYIELKKLIKVKEEKKKELPELTGVAEGKKVVLRVAPFPSGALHLGNAKTFILNALYAEKYNGKLLLVIDDTIGSVEKPVEEEAYDLIMDGFEWLGIKFSDVIYKSDRLKIYYKYAEKLIRKNKAYVCHCTQEEMQKNRKYGKECGCRQFPVKIQILRWKEFFKMKEGHGTLRIKTNMLDPDPAFRDRVLFKITDREHVRVGKKYRVWPTLEMSWAIDDHLLGITHIIRGNDLVMESKMEKYIWDIFNWKHPSIIHTGLVDIKGVKISKSKAQKEVKSGKFFGWNDPRTWSVHSLAWRGIRAEAIKEFVKEIGLNKQDITIPVESLYAVNRRMIDTIAFRYSFIANPIKLNIIGRPELNEVEIPIHPDREEKRKVKSDRIYISREDFEKFKGREIRLIYLFNIDLGRKIKFTSVENKNIQKINWVSDFVRCRILMPNGVWISGICDSDVQNLNKWDVIQFERFGFVSFNDKKKIKGEDVVEFWFAHK